MPLGYLHGKEIEEVDSYIDGVVVLKVKGDECYTVALETEIEVENEEAV